MTYKVELSKQAVKGLRKIDKHKAKIIISWIEKNLSNCKNPYLHGKALTHNKKGYWCYRVGSYRLIADINDFCITITLVNIGHRKEIYSQ